jgi:hypothetical protein
MLPLPEAVPVRGSRNSLLSEYIVLSASIGPIPSEYTITSGTTMSEYMMLSESSEILPPQPGHLQFPQVPGS